MWANVRIIVLFNALKVGSLRTRQMLKVDLCANGAGAYAPYAPPLPTGLYEANYIRVLWGWRRSVDERGLPELERNQLGQTFLELILDELMPWHEEMWDLSTLEVNR